MANLSSRLRDHISDDDLVIICEAALCALSDSNIADRIGDEMDLSYEVLLQLRARLEQVMEK